MTICAQSSCLGRRTLRNVSSIYLLKWHMCGFFAIEPSAAVSQGKLTNPLIALLVITECSWSRSVKPRRYFKLTSVLSPSRQVKEHSAKAFFAEAQRIRAATGRTTPVQVHFLHMTNPACTATRIPPRVFRIATMLHSYCSSLTIPKG